MRGQDSVPADTEAGTVEVTLGAVTRKTEEGDAAQIEAAIDTTYAHKGTVEGLAEPVAQFILHRPVLPLAVAAVRDRTVGGTHTQGKGAVEAYLGAERWHGDGIVDQIGLQGYVLRFKAQ